MEDFSSHLRGLSDTFAFPRALRVTEAAAWLHTAAGLHRQVETQGDLRGCGGTHTQNTYNTRVLDMTTVQLVILYVQASGSPGALAMISLSLSRIQGPQRMTLKDFGYLLSAQAGQLNAQPGR